MLLFVSAATVIMEYTPADRMGRVIATRQVVVAVVRTIALLGFGWLADQGINWLGDPSGVRAAILVMAGVSWVGTLVAAVGFPVLWSYVTRFEPGRQPQRITPTLGEVRTPSGVVAQFLDSHADPEFIVSEQRWLNAAVLAIVGGGWLMLLVTTPGVALGVLVVISATVVAYNPVRAILKRLRLSAEEQL